MATTLRALALAALLSAAATASARADECMRLVDVLPSRTFADGTHTVTLSPPSASLGQWFVTASGNDPGWVEVDGKTVVSPSDLAGPRRDRATVAVKLRPNSKLKVRVPGRRDRLTVRVFGVAPATALPAGVGKPVGDVVVFEELLPGGLPARTAARTVTAPGADGVLFLSAEQAGATPVLLSKVLWNDEAVLGATVLRPDCRPIVEPVVAHSTNTLETWVLGFPGSRMRVRLRGWIVDTVAPTATWASPAEGSAADAGTTLRLTWADAGTGVDANETKITLNGHDVTSAFTLGAAEATAPFAALPASALVAGTNVLRATVKDRACNATSVERRFTTGATPPDTTPPVLSGTPADLIVEQTGPAGAVVTYTAPTATDDRDPAPVVTCVPASGSTFTAGTTTVTCTARDASGNTTTATFTVTVRDTTPPSLADVPDLVVEQTGPTGTIVTYTAPTAVDAVDPTPVVSCLPAPGTLFPAGTTTVTCTAHDAAGNLATATFQVAVRDRTAPTFASEPEDLTVEQTGPTGATVAYTVPVATDAVDGSLEVNCSPASGTLFPPGSTLVVCWARDQAGNMRSTQFVVHVRDRTPPAIAIAEPAADATVAPGALLRVTYTDTVGVHTPSLVVLLNGRDVTSLLQVLPGAAQAHLGDLGLESGPVEVEAQVTDLGGNLGAASSAFTFVIPPAATQLSVEIPPAPGSPLQAGQAYDLTLRAVTATGDVAAAFTGVVTLTTTDPTSVLNGLVVDFDASHAGVRTLRGVARFSAVGSRSVTAMAVLGPPIEGRLDLVVERSERGRVIALLPSGTYFPGQTLSARIFVDMGASDGDPATFQDVLGAYDVRLLYDPRQVEIVRVDPGASTLGSPLFRLPGSVRLMDLNDLGTLSEEAGPDPSATGYVEVASIDLFVREGAPHGALSLGVTGDTLTTAVPAMDHTLLLSPVGAAGPRPGVLEGQVLLVSGVPAAGPVVLGVIPRDGEGVVSGAQTVQDAWAILSAPVDPSTLEHVTLSRDGAPVPGAAHLGEHAHEVRFTPAAPLEPGVYTFTVGAALGALGGGPLGQPNVSTFRVGPDLAAAAADLDRDGEVAILDLQVRRDVKGGRTQGTVPDFPPVFLSGTGPVEVGTVAGATVDLEVVDVDGGSVTLSSEGLPEGARLERSGENRFTLTIPGVAAGQSIPLEATATNGDKTLVTLVTTGTRANTGPSLLLRRANTQLEDEAETRRSAPFQMNEGEELYFEVEAVDLDFLDPTGADHVTFVAPTQSGVTFLERTGPHGERALYRYRPPFDQAGDRELEFSVRDDAGASTSLRIRVRVEDHDRPPEFAPMPQVFYVVQGQTVTLDWIASDPDGDPVEVAPAGAGEGPMAGNDQFAVVNQTSSPGRLSLTVRILRQGGSGFVTVIASDGQKLTAMSTAIVNIDSPPPITPTPPRLVEDAPNLNARQIFTNVRLELRDTKTLDDPETEENEATERGLGTGSYTIVGLQLGEDPITDVRVEGLSGTVAWSVVRNKLGVTIESDVVFGLPDGATRDGALLVDAGDETYTFPIVFLSHGLTTIYPPSIPPPPPDPPEPTPVLTLVQLLDEIEPVVRVMVKVPNAQFATALFVGGAALAVSPHPPATPPEGRPPTQSGDLVLDLDVYVGGVVTAPITLRVGYDGVLSEELSIPIPLGRRLPRPPVVARYGPDGALHQVSSMVPILPQGLRAEDQSLSPDNPYLLYVAVPRHPVKVMISTLQARLTNGTRTVDLPAPVSALGVPLRLAGAVENDYTVSLPIFLTFRSVPAGTMTPFRVLPDRIVVSLGAPPGGFLGSGGFFTSNGGFEGAYDHFVPAFARPGRVEDFLELFVGQSVEGGTPVTGEPLEARGFIPGLCGRPEVDPYTLRSENYLLDGAAVWCSDTIEAWDPYVGLSTLHVSDPAFATPSALAPESGVVAPNGTPFSYPVGENMRRAPGFLPGPNHLHLGRAPAASPGDPPGTSFDATFQLTTSNRAIPAKTGPGLVVDFSCDGARLGDPAQAAYLQADLALDDEEGPGVAKAGGSVYLATGEESIHRVDLVIPGIPGRPETDFRLERTYRSQIHFDGPMGYGWSSNWIEGLHFGEGEESDPSLTAPPSVTRVNGKARVAKWVRLSNGRYEAPVGHFGLLLQETGMTWVLRLPDGIKHRYDREGRLTSIESRYGNKLELVYHTGGNRQLDYILDVYRRKIDFTFLPSDDQGRDANYRLSQVVDYTGREVDYVYDERGDLVEARLPSGGGAAGRRIERYEYSFDLTRFDEDGNEREDLNHNLKKVWSPDDVARGAPPSHEITYWEGAPEDSNFDKVRHETEGDDALGRPRTRQFFYEDGITEPGISRASLRVSVQEPNDRLHIHLIDKERRLEVGLVEVSGGANPRTFTTTKLYNADGLLIRRVNPLGDIERFAYGTGDRASQRNLTLHVRVPDPVRGAGQRDIVTYYTYEPLFNQIASITDARGIDPFFRAPNPGNPVNPVRYTTNFDYDYQESTGVIEEAAQFGLFTGETRGLGDVNGDGTTAQAKGSCVRIRAPSVGLEPGSNEQRRTGSEVQQIVTTQRWSAHGQLLSSHDALGFVTEYRYYPSADPDGDGSTVFGSDLVGNAGYLAEKVVDSNLPSPGRATTPPPLLLVTRFGYDARGNTTSITDPRGVTTTMEHNVWNQPTRVTRGASNGTLVGPVLRLVTTQRYDHNGRVVEVEKGHSDGPTPASVVRTALTYDTRGDVLTRTVTGEGIPPLTTRFLYDANRNLIETTSPLQHKVRTEYDGRDLPIAVTRGFGSAEASTVTFVYDDNRNLVRTTDAVDNDGDGQRESTTFTYDGFNRLRKTTDALGGTVELTLDPLGQVTQRKVMAHPPGNPTGTRILLALISFDHDEHKRLYRTRAELFGHGAVAETVHAVVEYDAASRATYTVAPDGQLTTMTYDGAHRLRHTLDAAGNTTSVELDGNGNPVEVLSHEVATGAVLPAKDFRSTSEFDPLNRLVRTLDPVGHTRTFEYDARDNLVVQTDPEGPVPAPGPSAPNELGNVRRFEYDALDRLTAEVTELRLTGQGPGGERLGPVHPTNQVGLATSPFNLDGRIRVTYTWDDDSRLTAITDDNGSSTTFDYDALDRRSSRTLANDTTYFFFYDKDDNLTATVDPNGSAITRAHDALHRVTGSTVTAGPGVVGTTSQALAYDGLSRLVLAADDVALDGGATSETCRWTYDSFGRLQTEEQNGKVVRSRWMPDGRREALTYPGGRVLSTTPDKLDRVEAITDERASEKILHASYMGPGYRPLGRVVGKVGSETELLLGYDDAQRVTRLRWAPAHAPLQTFVDRQYTYNRASMRISERRNDDGGLQDRFTHDSAYRISHSSYGRPDQSTREVAYALDGVGNRRAAGDVAAIRSYSVDAVNRYARIGDVHRTHDRNGNLTDDGTFRYSYDAFDRLVGVFKKGGSPTDPDRLVAIYSYLADGRRSRARTWSTSGAPTLLPTRDVRFVYDGPQEIEEQTADGVTLATFVWGPEYVDSLVQFQRTADHPKGAGTFYVHQDARFDVVAVTDENGAVVERRRFDDFGNMEVRDSTGQVLPQSAVGLDYGFQGRRHDPETGLIYFRARYYDPATGRFISRDPVWDPMNMGNQYTFVGNSPVSGMDPTGEWGHIVAGGAIGGLIGGGVSLYQGEDFCSGAWKGALVGAAGAATFGLGLTGGTAAATWLGAGEGGALAAGVVTGGAVAGAAEGATAWGVGMNQGSFAENVGYGALFGGLSAGLVHGGGMAVRAGGRYALGMGEDLLYAMRSTPLPSYAQSNGLAGLGRVGDLAETFLEARGVRSRISQVLYGETDLSRAAIAYREANSLTRSGRNVAVYEYEDALGRLQTMARESIPRTAHAEGRIAAELAEMGVPASRVRRIYTELEPCVTSGRNCAGMLAREFPGAMISYTYSYGADRAANALSLSGLRAALRRIFPGRIR